MSHLKILCILPAYASKIGGMERVMAKIMDYPNMKCYDFSVCSLSTGQEIGQILNRDSVKLFEIPKKDRMDYAMIAKLVRILHREAPHIVHTRNFGGLIYGIPAAKIAGVSIIIHSEHGTGREVSNKNNIRRVLLQRMLSELTDQVVTVSETLKRQLIQNEGFPQSKLTVIYNGVDLTKFNISDFHIKEKRQELDLVEGEEIVGTVGRLEAIKDQKSLLLAFNEVIRYHHNVRLLIIGQGQMRNELENFAGELGLAESVSFLGHRDDIPGLMNIIDVFVLTSLNEGMSNVILEAMASSKPVIATNVGGNPELVVHGETGLLVPPKSPKLLAEALNSLLINQGMAYSMGNAARQRVEKYFSFDKTVAGYCDLYRSLYDKKMKIS